MVMPTDRSRAADAPAGPDAARPVPRPGAADPHAQPGPAAAGPGPVPADPDSGPHRPDAGSRHHLLTGLTRNPRAEGDPRVPLRLGQPAPGAPGEPESSSPSCSTSRRRDSSISSSAAIRPAQLAPSTDLPGSSSL